MRLRLGYLVTPRLAGARKPHRPLFLVTGVALALGMGISASPVQAAPAQSHTARAVSQQAPAAVDASPGQNKVLVVTSNNDSLTMAGLAALRSAGQAGGFVVVAPDPAAVPAQFTAVGLGQYKAVAFLDTGAASLLTDAQRTAFQDYINGGGGFVGIGSAAETSPDWQYLTSILGTRPDAASSDQVTAQDVEFLDRVHPATRDVPALVKGDQDIWYKWATNPTGSVHTVARARFASIPTADKFPTNGVPAYVTQTHVNGAGNSLTNDAVKDDSGGSNPNNNSDRPVSWCQDINQGRSFYTALGRTPSAFGSTDLQHHLGGAIQWAAGMVRGNCKATINKNYTATRLTPPDDPGTHDYIGEATHMSIARDGRVFYIGRASCFQGDPPGSVDWNAPNVGLGCGTIHVWDPRIPGSDTQNPNKITNVATLNVFGDKDGGPECCAGDRMEEGLVGIALDPGFTAGRPYIYVDYFPYFADQNGPGFQRYNFMTERRISRFTYDDQAKHLVSGSEKVILHYMAQGYSCCHTGADMAFDSQGNLYVPTGDMTSNTANGADVAYTNSTPNYTIPAGTPDNPAYGECTFADQLTDSRCHGDVVSFGDVRETSGNTNALDGKLIRIRPLPNPGATPALAPNDPGSPVPPGGPAAWGYGSTYTLPDANSPNGANMFAPDSPQVRDGLAKPEIYSMGLRNFYSVKIDPKTDLVTAASVGPDQRDPSNTWGPEGMDIQTLMPRAGNYSGWPYCQGGLPGLGDRKKLGGPAPGVPAPVGTAGTIPGPPFDANGQPTGGWFDCRNPILNDSPFNTGLRYVPAPQPVNLWWGHANPSGCPDYRRDQNMLPFNLENPQERFERCLFAVKNPSSGGDLALTAGIYRGPTMTGAGQAWPAYWQGRWFVFNANAVNGDNDALLMPDHPDSSSQAIAADNLRAIITSAPDTQGQFLGLQFGPDGCLYLVDDASSFNISPNTALWRICYTGGPDTPGPDPQAAPASSANTVQFSTGKSGGVSYHWDFGDGTTSDQANPAHVYGNAGQVKATLTVTYADGQKASKTVTATAPA